MTLSNLLDAFDTAEFDTVDQCAVLLALAINRLPADQQEAMHAAIERGVLRQAVEMLSPHSGLPSVLRQ